jgi:predicted permease
MRAFYQDLRFGLRLLLSTPGFTAVAVLTLALGIAANTTVFSWIDGILLRPYPGATAAGQLAVLETGDAGTANGGIQTSYLDYRDFRRDLKSLSGLAIHREDVFSVGDSMSAQAVWGELVSGNYFAVLGVKPALGRTFTAEEDGDKLGAYPVAVISHALWRSYFHADPKAIGKTVRVNRRELTVVGVAPPGFRGTMPGLVFHLWVPVTMGKELAMLDESTFRERGRRGFYAVARLRPGASIGQARAEAAAYAHNLELAWPKTNLGVPATILPPWEFHSAAPGLLLKPLRILMAVSLVVLLIVCANVANLLLARSLSRRKELSIRLALGAGGGRLTRQLLTETMLLAVAGTFAGLLLAPWLADLLPSLVPKIGVQVAVGFQMSGRVLAFTILTCGATVLFSGAAPVIFWLRSSVHEALKEGGRSSTHGPQSHRIRGLLVTSEVALSTLALIGAGLFVRSFQNACGLYPGFDKNNVVLMRFYPAALGSSTRDMQQFCLRLQERFRSAPGVTDAVYADYVPLGAAGGPWSDIQVEGYTPPQGNTVNVNRYMVAPGYFTLMHIPLLDGRDFTVKDAGKTQPVIIVNQTFAQRYFAGANPLGRRIRWRGKWATVVGLARDSKYFDIAEAPRPHFFAPFLQEAGADQSYYFFIKTAGDPVRIMARLRREVLAVDSSVAAFDVMPLTEWMDITMLPQKVAASVMGGLGLLSLVLAALGLYSVMAYSVAQRTQEIGIRMALGAQPRNVLGGVLREGAVFTLPGLVAGTAAAYAVTRLVSGMLVNIGAADPATFAEALLFLAVVALLAVWLPARRATRVDPMVALRRE